MDTSAGTACGEAGGLEELLSAVADVEQGESEHRAVAETECYGFTATFISPHYS